MTKQAIKNQSSSESKENTILLKIKQLVTDLTARTDQSNKQLETVLKDRTASKKIHNMLKEYD